MHNVRSAQDGGDSSFTSECDIVLALPMGLCLQDVKRAAETKELVSEEALRRARKEADRKRSIARMKERAQRVADERGDTDRGFKKPKLEG